MRPSHKPEDLSPVEPLAPSDYRDLIRRALDEDVGDGDITTNATVPEDARGRGVFVAKAECIVAGLDVAIETFRQVATVGREAEPQIDRRRTDGDRCSSGDEIATVTGSARTLLVGERTALNFLQRLCGIATRTRRFVEAAHGRITILDTRKTTPTLRRLEKYAVRVGGGTNHRIGLFDAVLIKDNHIRIAGSIAGAIARVRAHRPGQPVEVEAQSLAEVDEALAAHAETILVDNMSTADVRTSVERARGRARIEISGGVTLDRLAELAATGADFVSVGALTHSAPAIDISFEIESL